jgi:hypothetical protein
VIVQTLQDFVGSQERFGMVQRGLLKADIEFLTRVAWRQM